MLYSAQLPANPQVAGSVARFGLIKYSKELTQKMSAHVVKEVIFVAMGDEIFRRQLVSEPEETLSQFDLTWEETKALMTGDKAKLVKLGLDEGLAQYGQLLLSKKRN